MDDYTIARLNDEQRGPGMSGPMQHPAQARHERAIREQEELIHLQEASMRRSERAMRRLEEVNEKVLGWMGVPKRYPPQD